MKENKFLFLTQQKKRFLKKRLFLQARYAIFLSVIIDPRLTFHQRLVGAIRKPTFHPSLSLKP
jgi:hypothetical protein